MTTTHGRTTYRSWFKFAFWAFLIVFVLAVGTGDRLPWIRTEMAGYFSYLVLFPLLFAMAVWFAFFARRKDGRTGYQVAISTKASKSQRAALTLSSAIGAVFIPAAIAHTAYVFPAWAAELLARDSYADVHTVSGLKLRNSVLGNRYYEVNLRDRVGNDLVLPYSLAIVDRDQWQPGEALCIRGRTSIFGTIVVSVTRNTISCSV